MKKKNRRMSLFWCMLLICSHALSQKPEDLFFVNTNCSNCSDCISVSKDIEKDDRINKLLSAYLYNCLIGGYDCQTLTSANLHELYRRGSFKTTIILFYTDTNLRKLNVYEDVRMWTERYKQLLYGIKDLNLLHNVANELLQYHVFDGIQVLWERADLSKLPNLNKELNSMNVSNFFVCAELSAFYRIVKAHEKSNKYLLKARKIEGFENEYQALVELLNSKSKFSYLDFQEAVFGGM